MVRWVKVGGNLKSMTVGEVRVGSFWPCRSVERVECVGDGILAV